MLTLNQAVTLSLPLPNAEEEAEDEEVAEVVVVEDVADAEPEAGLDLECEPGSEAEVSARSGTVDGDIVMLL